MKDEFQFPELPPEIQKMLTEFDSDFKAGDLDSVYEKLDKIASDMKNETKKFPAGLSLAMSNLSSRIVNEQLQSLYSKATIIELASIAGVCHQHIRLGRVIQKYLDKEGGE